MTDDKSLNDIAVQAPRTLAWYARDNAVSAAEALNTLTSQLGKCAETASSAADVDRGIFQEMKEYAAKWNVPFESRLFEAVFDNVTKSQKERLDKRTTQTETYDYDDSWDASGGGGWIC